MVPFNNSYHESDKVNEKLARETARASQGNSERLKRLEKEVEKLSLLCETLTRFVGENLQSANLDLAYEVEETVRQRAQRSKEKNQCNKCNMLVPSNQEKCMYCGESFSLGSGKNFFD